MAHSGPWRTIARVNNVDVSRAAAQLHASRWKSHNPNLRRRKQTDESQLMTPFSFGYTIQNRVYHPFNKSMVYWEPSQQFANLEGCVQ